MKRSERLMFFCAVLCAACAVTFGVVRTKEQKEKIKNSDAVILTIPADTVTALSWETGTENLSFHKEEMWTYDEDAAFPVDEEKIGELLEIFEEFGVSFVIEDVEDYGQYGLDDPEGTIRLEAGEESYEILLGDFSAMDSERYVSIGDGNAYLVKEDPMDSFNIGLSSVIKNDQVPAMDQVERIRFTGPEAYEIFYEEDSTATYSPGDIYFTSRDEKTLPLDTSRVTTYLNTVMGLGLSDYVSYNAAEEELSGYGLDEPQLVVETEYTTENEDGKEETGTFTLSVSRDPEEKEDDETVTAYARVGESGIIYRLLSGDYEKLMKMTYNDLRHQEVLPADRYDITGLTVVLEGETYQLESRGKDSDRKWTCAGEETDTAALLDALLALEAESFTEEAPVGKEEIRMTVFLDNENYPQVTVALYRYDGEYCLAEVDGEPVSLVPRSQAVDLTEAVHGIVLSGGNK